MGTNLSRMVGSSNSNGVEFQTLLKLGIGSRHPLASMPHHRMRVSAFLRLPLTPTPVVVQRMTDVFHSWIYQLV